VIKTVNWKEAKAMVAIVMLGAMSITCIVTGTDGLLLGLFLGAIAGIAGYELGQRKRVES